MDNNIFDNILADGEYVLKTYRPNKKRYLISVLVVPFLAFLFFIAVTAGMFLLVFLKEKDEFDPSVLVPFYIFVGIFILVWLISLINILGNYKNLVYCLTNKRLIMRRNIRTEVFDFMDLKEVTFTHVRVDRWDKIMKPQTGSIVFSNNKFSGNVIRYSRYPNGIAIMSFQFVEDPYDVLKYIQGIADIAKSEGQ